MGELSRGTKPKSAKYIADTKARSKSAVPLTPARLPAGSVTAAEVEAVDALLVALGDLAGFVKFGGLVARLAAEGLLILAIRLPEGAGAQMPAAQEHPRLGRLLFFDPTDSMTSLGYLPESA